jgi:hypothetical protein
MAWRMAQGGTVFLKANDTTTIYTLLKYIYPMKVYHYRRILGFTAFKPRTLKAGESYQDCFAMPTGENELIRAHSLPITTVEEMVGLIKEDMGEGRKIAERLLQESGGRRDEKLLKHIWNFFYTHYQYKEDEAGKEQIKSPNFSWANRVTGIDCDDYTFNISIILSNLSVNHYLRVVKMYGKQEYQHIYIVVPKTKQADMRTRANYWVLDPVVDWFDYEPQGITHITDKPMSIPLYHLSGLQGTIPAEDSAESLKEWLVKLSRDLESYRPSLTPVQGQDLTTFQGYVTKVLSYWHDPELRKQALAVASLKTQTLDLPMFSYMNAMDFDKLFGYGSAIVVGGQTIGSLEGGKLKNAFEAVRRKVENVATKVGQAAKQVGKALSKVAKEALDDLKKVGHVAARLFPTAIAVRGLILLAIKKDARKLGSRLALAYMTDGQLSKRGIDAKYRQQAQLVLGKFKNIWYGIGGDVQLLERHIQTSKAASELLGTLGWVVQGDVSGVANLPLVYQRAVYRSRNAISMSDRSDHAQMGGTLSGGGPAAIAAAAGLVGTLLAIMKEHNLSFKDVGHILGLSKKQQEEPEDKDIEEDLAKDAGEPDPQGQAAATSPTTSPNPPEAKAPQSPAQPSAPPAAPTSPPAKESGTNALLVGVAALVVIGVGVYVATSDKKHEKGIGTTDHDPTPSPKQGKAFSITL